ncbi:MAG: glycosyltransferase, partial [Actinomycetota bacterium]|nr:glycosyltransferase [Actinomycetota bacterium]
AYAARNPAIRYVRQPINLGPTPNFEQLRGLAKGDYFLFLGDDDWIDPGYISACVQAIEANPGSALVAGRTMKHGPGGAEPDRFPTNIVDPDPRQRVVDFCRQVRANGVFYGVMPIEVDQRAPRLRNVQGGDMVHVMALAYLGPVRTVDHVAIHRTVGGMTVNLANVAATLGLGWFQAAAPQIAISYWIFRDIAFDSPLYAELGRLGRLWLGLRAGGTVSVRFVPPAVLKFARLQIAAISGRLRPRATALAP